VSDGAPDALPDGDGPVGGPRLALVAAAVLAVIVVAFIAILATRDSSNERVDDTPLLGRLAPATAGATIDGGSFDIDDHRGEWVFVNFFASWCVPCIQEHPELRAFDEAHRERGDAVLVSVTYSNSAEEAREFFEERGGSWPVIDDPTNSIGVAYGVAQVPETFVVAPDGTVVARFAGEVTRDAMERIMREAGG
jgi:cytochrome c biogenesis protein CcmG/thiol:disulfide interchange protein DsbE